MHILYMETFINSLLYSFFSYHSLKGFVPRYIQDMFYYVSHGESFRLNIPSIKTKIGSRALSVIGPKVCI